MAGTLRRWDYLAPLEVTQVQLPNFAGRKPGARTHSHSQDATNHTSWTIARRSIIASPNYSSRTALSCFARRAGHGSAVPDRRADVVQCGAFRCDFLIHQHSCLNGHPRRRRRRYNWSAVLPTPTPASSAMKKQADRKGAATRIASAPARRSAPGDSLVRDAAPLPPPLEHGPPWSTGPTALAIGWSIALCMVRNDMCECMSDAFVVAQAPAAASGGAAAVHCGGGAPSDPAPGRRSQPDRVVRGAHMVQPRAVLLQVIAIPGPQSKRSHSNRARICCMSAYSYGLSYSWRTKKNRTCPHAFVLLRSDGNSSTHFLS